MKLTTILRAAVFSMVAMSASAHAQVTTIVVPFASGGPTDTSARIVAAAMSKQTGATFVVENVPGAGATIGATKVALAKPDGTMLLWGSGSTLAMTPHLYPALKYDPVKSFAPIGLVAAQPFILVVKSTRGIKNVKELVALAKAAPGKLNFSSTGQGASSHLVAELFKAATGISATHIPYNGGAPGLNALLAGDVDFFFDTPTTVVPHIKAGKLRALAVTGKSRWEPVPGVPTMQEVGLADFDATTWFGLVAPAGTPPERVSSLSKSLLAVLADAPVSGLLRDAGFLVEPSSPDEFAKKIAADSARWGGIIKSAGIKLN